MNTRQLRMAIAALWVLVLGSSLGVVYAKQESRNRFNELQKLTKARDDLDIEWGQLQLEQATWATHSRVEQVARAMNMGTPPVADVRIVQP